MGLDIYAGTLTRYYSHNWKTVVQQWAEENGYAFNRITPDGEAADNEEEMSPAEVQAVVENWRDQILSAISQPGQPPYAPWPEDNEKPYYTDKPDWDAFGAMLLVAACHTYNEPVPSTVEKDWNFGEHPLVARLASDEERVWSLFRGATWWLPLADAFFFQAPLPTDNTAAIRMQADIYLLVPHKDLSATPQSILLHEIGHMMNLALTGAMEVQPDDFQVVSALLHLNLDGVDCKEFFAHCFAMSLLIEPELNSADPFTMVSKTDKKAFRSYFTYKLKTAE